jgi:Ca2+-binding RTX toxin-like protein
MPASLSLTGSTVLENAAQGTVVGTLSAWDPDGDSTFNFTLLDDAGGRFALQGNQLVVANGFLLDYEQATSHQVMLRVADGHGGSFEQNITLSLIDVLNEKSFGSSSANRMIGGKGNDWLSGGAGNDFISAGAGNDRVEGGSGDDNLNGGYGKDTLTGGSGKDQFVFSEKPSKTGNLDAIGDFSVKDDSIWLDNAVFPSSDGPARR